MELLQLAANKIEVLKVFCIIWTASSEFGTYRLCEQAKVQASLRIRAVSPEPSLLAHTSSESRGTFRQKARSLAPLTGWTCAVKICHGGMLEDTKSLDGAHIIFHKAIHLVLLGHTKLTLSE